MNFKERKSPTTTVKVRPGNSPVVHITEQALNKMFIYTDEVTDEVGWLGTVDKQGNVYTITDVYLFDQEVHGATTEISPEGLADFATKLLEQPDGMEIWNSMKMWGHSHVNMGITPSGQDNKQMEELSQIGHDFFLRLICNKKGDMGIDLYDYEAGVEYHNVPWLIEHDVMDEATFQLHVRLQELKTMLEEAESQIQETKKAKIETLKEPIKAEIKEKVKKFRYTAVKPNTQVGVRHGAGSQGYPYYGNQYPQYGHGAIRVGFNETSSIEDKIDGVKGTVYDYFTQKEIILIANTTYGYQDFVIAMEEEYADEFSKNDLDAIWKEVSKYSPNVHGYY